MSDTTNETVGTQDDDLVIIEIPAGRPWTDDGSGEFLSPEELYWIDRHVRAYDRAVARGARS